MDISVCHHVDVQQAVGMHILLNVPCFTSLVLDPDIQYR